MHITLKSIASNNRYLSPHYLTEGVSDRAPSSLASLLFWVSSYLTHAQTPLVSPTPFRIKATVLPTAHATFKTRFCFWLPLLCHIHPVLAITPGNLLLLQGISTLWSVPHTQMPLWPALRHVPETVPLLILFSALTSSKTQLLGCVCHSPPWDMSFTGCVQLHTERDQQVYVQ